MSTEAEAVELLSNALVEAQAEFSSVGKSGENKYDKYRYAMLEDFVGVAKPVLAKHGFAVVISILEVIPVADRETKGGTTEHVVRVKISLRLIHKGGGMVETFSFGEGQDRADKAIYKAITGARKYGLASLLGLATTDDPEADENVGHDGGSHTANAPKPPTSPPTPPPAPRPTKPATAAPIPQVSGSIANPEPAGGTSSVVQEPVVVAPPDVSAVVVPPDLDGDPSLTRDSGPCADCGVGLAKAMTTFIVNARKRNGQVRWSHRSIPGLDKDGQCDREALKKIGLVKEETPSVA